MNCKACGNHIQTTPLTCPSCDAEIPDEGRVTTKLSEEDRSISQLLMVKLIGELDTYIHKDILSPGFLVMGPDNIPSELLLVYSQILFIAKEMGL